MFDTAIQSTEILSAPAPQSYVPTESATISRDLEAMLKHWPFQRRKVQAKQYVFRAGQPRQSLFLVHAGFFKTCLISEDGREMITGFRLRGDLLGLDINIVGILNLVQNIDHVFAAEGHSKS